MTLDLDRVRNALRQIRPGTNPVEFYKRTFVPKRGGGHRTLAEPVGFLREVQDWLVEHVWPALLIGGYAHGFVAGRSIMTHAAVHAPAHTLATLDIADFFGSVRPEAGIDALCTAKIPHRLAVDIARLCWLPNGLPQGAPTSPGLANACFTPCDAFLATLARLNGARYSRYVDDLAFSWQDEPRAEVPLSTLAGAALILASFGFRRAEEKTRIAGPNDQQIITGLVINAAKGRPAIRAPRGKWRALRAGVHNAERGKEVDLNALYGLASFLAMTDPERVAPYTQRLHELVAATKEQS